MTEGSWISAGLIFVTDLVIGEPLPTKPIGALAGLAFAALGW